MTSSENRAENATDPVTFLAGYADAYKANHFDDRVTDVGLTVSKIDTVAPVDCLRFIYHHYAFNRAGGAAAGYNEIAVNAVNTVGGAAPDELWSEFVNTCDERNIGVNARVNEGAVKGVASLVEEHGNLFAWTDETVTTNESVTPVYTAVNDIRGLGEKITRFFVRDAVWIADVEANVLQDEREYLQPMDVWTRRVAHILWEDTWDATDTDLSQRAAAACTERSVSNAEFNQGAWYLGAKEHNGNTEAFVEDLIRVNAQSEER